MSYRCDKCNAVREGSELNRVSEIREVTYNKMFLRFDRREKRKVEQFGSNSKGTEVVTVERLCEGCFEETKDLEPRVSNKPKTVKFIGIRGRDGKSSTGRSDTNLDIKGLKNKWEGKR